MPDYVNPLLRESLKKKADSEFERSNDQVNSDDLKEADENEGHKTANNQATEPSEKSPVEDKTVTEEPEVVSEEAKLAQSALVIPSAAKIAHHRAWRIAQQTLRPGFVAGIRGWAFQEAKLAQSPSVIPSAAEIKSILILVFLLQNRRNRKWSKAY